MWRRHLSARTPVRSLAAISLLTLVLPLSVVANTSGADASTNRGFRDVSPGSRFAADIRWLAASGITQGCDSGQAYFCPNGSVTRGQMAAFMARALSLTATSSRTFRDVPRGHTFHREINRLAAAGITQGCDSAGTRFCPDEPVTRGQMAAFMARALRLTATSSRTFRDVPRGHTFHREINRLAAAGITQGCDSAGTRFCPDGAVSREQMAAFLRRALDRHGGSRRASERLPGGARDEGAKPTNPTPTPNRPAQGENATQVARHGITWTFDSTYEVGQYANGDYWVVGPLRIVGVSPASTSAGWHGSMVNPDPKVSSIGYGPVLANNYRPSLNVARQVSASTPLTLAPHSSLVSTIGTGDSTARPGLRSAAVLTVVAEPPPEGAFRPPYTGNDKTSYFTEDHLRYDLLPRLAPVQGTPSISSVARQFERVWLDHQGGWVGRKIHPSDNMPDYGRDLAARLGQGSLMLMLDYPDHQKRDLLVNYVQIGIDLHGIVASGGSWPPDGGHAQGRKWPILFAGVMLDDPAMSDIGHSSVFFGEDAQTFYVTQQDVNRGVGYTSANIGLPEWGIRHATDPSRDNANWGADPYRRCCTANSWGGHVLSARIMGLQDAWNHDALFDYTDRYLDREAAGSWPRFWDRPFSERMWDTYRPLY